MPRRLILAPLILFAVLFVVSLFLPVTSSVEASRHIDAPAQAVHALLADLERWDAWSGWPLGDASNQHLETDASGNPVLVWGAEAAVPGRLVIRASLPERGVWYDLEWEGLPATRGAVHFAPASGASGSGPSESGSAGSESDRAGTRVTWSVREEYTGNPFARYRGLLVRGSMRTLLDQGLAQLESLVTEGAEPDRAIQDGPSGSAKNTGSGAGQVDDPRVARAFQHIGRGDLNLARELLEEVLLEQPDHGRAALGLGLVHHQRKHYASAAAQLETARSAAPFEQQEVVDYYLAWCLYRLGDAEGARAAFQRYAAANPAEGDALFGLGLVDLEAGALDDAEAHFRRASELFGAARAGGKSGLESELAKTHARLADVYEQRGDDASARRELERALQLWPPHYAAWYKLARVYERLGMTDEAARARELFEHWKRERERGR